MLALPEELTVMMAEHPKRRRASPRSDLRGLTSHDLRRTNATAHSSSTEVDPKTAPDAARTHRPRPALGLHAPATSDGDPGEKTPRTASDPGLLSGGERTRTADFYVANVPVN